MNVEWSDLFSGRVDNGNILFQDEQIQDLFSIGSLFRISVKFVSKHNDLRTKNPFRYVKMSSKLSPPQGTNPVGWVDYECFDIFHIFIVNYWNPCWHALSRESLTGNWNTRVCHRRLDLRSNKMATLSLLANILPVAAIIKKNWILLRH